MKLGFNTVLFGGHDMAVPFQFASVCGYDGIEISAIDGASEHLVLDRWQEIAPRVKGLAREHAIEVLAMEQPDRDPEKMERAFQAAVEIGIPIINCGPGGATGDESGLNQCIDELGHLTKRAEHHGVTLCVKAHVGRSVYNTPTTLKVLEAIDSPAFGLDMDPSHIHRANENPDEALEAVITRIRHVHIRDCKGRQQGPGDPPLQANGRGDIDLLGFVRVLHEHGYTGALNLEVIGAKSFGIPECVAIAAESRGHMQACLQAAGAR